MDAKASTPLVWILLGKRPGDNNQMIALADGLRLPYEAKILTHNRLRSVRFLRDERLLYLTPEARRKLAPPWPDLVIGLGYDSIPVSRAIRRWSEGRTRLVQIGNPRTTLEDIDLVITSPQYSLGDAPNILALPLPVGNPARDVTPTQEENAWLKAHPRPRRLVAVGGSTRQWKIDQAELGRALESLKEKRTASGGSVIAVTSRRTPRRIGRFLESTLTDGSDSCVHNFPRFSVLLAECDEVYVTADSVSMLAEAIFTRKPVGIIPITRSARGKVDRWMRQTGLKFQSHSDMPRFWRFLSDNRLVGTVESPTSSDVPDTIETAVAAVQDMLRRPPPVR
jgi:hypothetical protein